MPFLRAPVRLARIAAGEPWRALSNEVTLKLLLSALASLSLSLFASLTTAQEAGVVYQTEKDLTFKLHGDLLLRREWTRDVFESANLQRNRAQFRPRAELAFKKLLLGVGGEFNYSSDENTLPPPGAAVQALIRDNYDSRDARLDLAFATLRPTPWLRVEGGRFLMPVGFTEMIWDRDLRPQGGAVTLETQDRGRLRKLGLTVLGAQGSHVFDDDDTRMLVVSSQGVVGLGEGSRLDLTVAYLTWDDVPSLETRLRRQNTRVAGQIVREYEVVDVVARLAFDAPTTIQLVADLCWNTAVDDQDRGVWLAAVLGSTRTSRARGEYVYAKVDKDATVAAYGADDFFWATGWEGHRVDLGVRLHPNVALHGVGQAQRFKDAPRAEERDHWQKRYRLDLRATF